MPYFRQTLKSNHENRKNNKQGPNIHFISDKLSWKKYKLLFCQIISLSTLKTIVTDLIIDINWYPDCHDIAMFTFLQLGVHSFIWGRFVLTRSLCQPLLKVLVFILFKYLNRTVVEWFIWLGVCEGGGPLDHWWIFQFVFNLSICYKNS